MAQLLVHQGHVDSLRERPGAVGLPQRVHVDPDHSLCPSEPELLDQGQELGGPCAVGDQVCRRLRTASRICSRRSGSTARTSVACPCSPELDFSKRAKTIRNLAQEQRRAIAEARLIEPPPEDPTRFLLASAEAMQAARAIDWIVDDERRDRVLAFVAAELEADMVACPLVDEGGA